MAKAFIPEIGTRLKLEKDWTFDVYLEHRNKHIFKLDGHRAQRWNEPSKSYKRTLPKGSTFQVDRIYVRNGAEEYSSVTLLILDTTDSKLTSNGKKTQPFRAKGAKHYGRFWVKLIQFNDAEFTVTHDATRPAEVKEVCGEPITLRRFKSRKNARWWVKFEHKNPELAFDDAIYQQLLSDSRWHKERSHDLIRKGWEEIEHQREDWNRRWYTEYTYKPPYYFSSLVPTSWKEANADVAEYLKKRKGLFGMEMEVVEHPLEDEIHISRLKKERVKLGLPNDKALLKRVPLAGGFLTVCEVKEVEA